MNQSVRQIFPLLSNQGKQWSILQKLLYHSLNLNDSVINFKLYIYLIFLINFYWSIVFRQNKKQIVGCLS